MVLLNFVTAPFSGLFGMLEVNKVDTIANQIAITPERSEVYLFSDPYSISSVHLAVHKDNETIKGVEDLDNATVGVSLGSNYEQIIKEKNTKLKCHCCNL